MQLQPGTPVLNGRFRIERLLGVDRLWAGWLRVERAQKVARNGELDSDAENDNDFRRSPNLSGRF